MRTSPSARTRGAPLRVLLVIATAMVMAMGLYGGLLRIGVPLPSSRAFATLRPYGVTAEGSKGLILSDIPGLMRLAMPLQSIDDRSVEPALSHEAN